MATNLELKIAALETRIKKLESQGFTSGEAINQIQFEETTKITSDLIRESYDAINKAIQEAKKQNLPANEINKIFALKKEVPKKYAISKEAMQELNTILNNIVGGQSSVTF